MLFPYCAIGYDFRSRAVRCVSDEPARRLCSWELSACYRTLLGTATLFVANHQVEVGRLPTQGADRKFCACGEPHFCGALAWFVDAGACQIAPLGDTLACFSVKLSLAHVRILSRPRRCQQSPQARLGGIVLARTRWKGESKNGSTNSWIQQGRNRQAAER